MENCFWKFPQSFSRRTCVFLRVHTKTDAFQEKNSDWHYQDCNVHSFCRWSYIWIRTKVKLYRRLCWESTHEEMWAPRQLNYLTFFCWCPQCHQLRIQHRKLSLARKWQLFHLNNFINSNVPMSIVLILQTIIIVRNFLCCWRRFAENTNSSEFQTQRCFA